MNLGNIKKIKIEDIFRIFLVLVFLSAGIFRIFNPELAQQEAFLLGLPTSFSYFLSIFEVTIGFLLLIHVWTRLVYGVLAGFLIAALELAFVIKNKEIFSSISELFVFDLNPTDIFLHLVFLFIVVLMIFREKK